MRTAQTALAGLLLLGGFGGGCANRSDPNNLAPGGLNTYSEARRYVDKAVRRSTEGVILIPSRKAETIYDRSRLNDIAQALRVPAAVCFVNRAIETMKLTTNKDGDQVFKDVPEGQIRIRTRINSAGQVVRTEVIESGFKDERMYPCFDEAIKKVKWTTNKTGAIQFIDIVYWVSLGYQAEDHAAKGRELLRKQTAAAAVKAKQCLAGRVGVGRYKVDGLSLVDRDGRTLANRVEPGVLPDNVSECVAIQLRAIRMAQVKEAFVRPVLPHVEFVVDERGDVTFVDEPWLALIQREEEAMREARLAETDAALDDPSTAVDEAAIPSGVSMPTDGSAAATSVASKPTSARPSTAATTPPSAPLDSTSVPSPTPASGVDPAAGGLKLKLGGLRDQKPRAGSGTPAPPTTPPPRPPSTP